jgi:uncharacterized protein YjbI with pentapeptide repeats
MNTCQIHKIYPEIKCRRRAMASDEFCILHSGNKDKDQGVFDTVFKKKLTKGDYDFRGVFFPGRVSFLGHEFKKEADFSLAIFSSEAVFSGATFSCWADFSMAAFCGIAAFSGATFPGGADFSRASFYGRADFFQTIFSKAKQDEFTNATGKADFYQFTLIKTKRTDFTDAIFIGIAFFSDATFSGRADFSRVIFSRGADFSRTTFSGRAIFYMAIFSENTDFSVATFSDRAFFFETTFSADTDFSGATFFWTVFSGVTFKQRVAFSGATVTRRLSLTSLNPKEPGMPPPQVFEGNFVYVEVVREAVLRFRDLSLARSIFAGTDLRRVEFVHVDWHINRWGRKMAYDEDLLSNRESSLSTRLASYTGIVSLAREVGLNINEFMGKALPLPNPPTSNEYGEVERLYRNLKMSYISAGDNKNAGDFYYGEMEMHRRASRWRRVWVYWYNLYRFLSGYGERPSWALGWLVLLLAALTGLLSLPGLNNYLRRSAEFGDPFFYLLQAATLQRPIWAEPAGFWGKLVAGLSVLLISGQAALFLLALRNRLGRRR